MSYRNSSEKVLIICWFGRQPI